MKNEEKIGSLAHLSAQIFAAFKPGYTQIVQAQPAVMYHLDGKPPVAVVTYPEGVQYKIEVGGQAYIMLGASPVPLQPGQCPHPEAWAKLYVGAFFWKYRKQAAWFLYLGAMAIILQCIASGFGLPTYILPMLIGISEGIFLLALLSAFICAILYNFGRGVSVRMDKDEPMLLSASVTDIRPDILVMSGSDNEDPDKLLERVRDAKAGHVAGRYVLLVPFRTGQGVIILSGHGDSNEITFGRGSLVKDVSGWKSEVSAPRPWHRETWAEYQNYMACLCAQFAVWAKEEKIRRRGSEGIMDDLKARAKEVVFSLLFLLASLGVSAQSAAQVPEKFKSKEEIEQAAKEYPKSIMSGVPDSLELQQMKRNLMLWKSGFGRELGPRQDFIAWFFHNFIVPLLLLVLVPALFFAKAAFKEGSFLAKYGYHARRVVFGCATLIALYEIIDIMVASFFNDSNLWWGGIKSAAVAVIAYYVVTWITPNPDPQDDIRVGNRGEFPVSGQRQIPSRH